MIEEYLARKFRATNLPIYLQDEKKLASVYRRLRTAGFSSGASIRVLKRYAAQAEELEGLEDAAPSESASVKQSRAQRKRSLPINERTFESLS